MHRVYKRWKWLDRGVRQISDAANVLLKAEEFRRMIPESETKCNRTSPLCNRYRTEKQNIEQTKGKPNQCFFRLKVSGTLKHELQE